MKRFWLAALLAVALGGCGVIGSGGGDGGEGAAAVRPSRVTPEALRAEATDPKLVRFYEARQWQPAWDRTTAASLVERLAAAPRHGLDPRAFLAGIERKEEPAAREAALSLAALDYAEALARGRADPAQVFDVYTLQRPDPDLAGGLNGALEGGDVGAWLDGLAPQDEEYRLLGEAYAAAIREQGAGREPIPGGAAIRPGGADRRLGAIAEALRARGYLSAPAEGEAPAAVPERYSDALVAAVRQLQEDHGLEANGVIGEGTLAALNMSAADRAHALAVNLERRRWTSREAAPTRIDVNIAAATLTYWRNGAVADRRRVVVGQPGNETPELASPMFRLVANPTWTVPKSIEEEEIAPRGEAYLARNNMTRRDGMIVQGSGPTNALGLVKFDMKNDHAIYLHDTPAKALFSGDRRYFSHGCVRVHDALGFAAMIAAQEGVSEQWERARATGEETFVPLPREIPVRLMYRTAFVDEGRIRFLPDVYGWDEELGQSLGLPQRARRARPDHVADVGP